MWDSPHEGIAVIYLLGREMRIRFDWATFSRIEFHYQGKEDLNNPVHLSEILSQGLETFHPGEVSAKQVMSARLPVVYLATRVRDAFDYALGTHPKLTEKPSESEAPTQEAPKNNRISEAYRVALKVGVDPEMFWRLTPYQTSMKVLAFNEAHKEEVKHDLWRAWHTGVFSREDYKLPKYETLFPPPKPKLPPNETARERGLRLKAELLAAFPPRSQPLSS
jgi:hypothetical protein